MGWPLWLALLAILVIGGVFGLFNGILIAKFGLPPFIATLGTMMISRGLSSIVSNVQSVTFHYVELVKAGTKTYSERKIIFQPG